MKMVSECNLTSFLMRRSTGTTLLAFLKSYLGFSILCVQFYLSKDIDRPSSVK